MKDHNLTEAQKFKRDTEWVDRERKAAEEIYRYSEEACEKGRKGNEK